MQSISVASLLKCRHFRSSRPEFFCKRDVLINFPEFTGVSSGTGVSCVSFSFQRTLFFAKHLKWLLLAFALIETFYSYTVCNKSAADTWICLVSFYGRSKDFIFTYIFLKTITFFIKCDIVSSVFHSLDQNLIREKRSYI